MPVTTSNLLFLPALLAWVAIASHVEAQQCFSQLVFPGDAGKLVYVPDAQGNRIPDFSNVGYKSGIVPLPDVPVRSTLNPDVNPGSDDGARLQAAIDQVSGLPPDPNGFRGAVVLTRGEYRIGGTLFIRASGVVLRGDGQDPNGTVIRATGVRPGAAESTLVRILGSGSRVKVSGTEHNLIQDYVPVGARTFLVDNTDGLNVGDEVIVHRPSTAEWIATIGMDQLVNPWQPGSKDINWDRLITSINGTEITVDAPLTTAVEQQFGGGTIYKYTWPGRIQNVGIEQMRGVSDFTSPTDEDHAWNFIKLENVMNAWVQSITAEHFAYAAVNVAKSAKWITVDSSSNLDPISGLTGGRRYSFNVDGQLTLVKNGYTREGRHDYVLGSTIPGPNVFVDSVAENTHADAGPHHRWSSGTLFDNVVAGEINVRDRGNSGTGHGWAGANTLVWNSTASRMIIEQPPTAQNWSIGNTTPRPSGDGWWESLACPVQPRSLYYAQLAERMAALAPETPVVGQNAVGRR
jgi:hypothetical protein